MAFSSFEEEEDHPSLQKRRKLSFFTKKDEDIILPQGEG